MTHEPGAHPDLDARAKLAEKLVAVRERFLAGFDDRVTELVALAQAASSASGADGQAARHALGRGLHTIAGSAPTIGLPLLGQHARVLEAELAKADGSGTGVRPGFVDDVAKLCDTARRDAQ